MQDCRRTKEFYFDFETYKTGNPLDKYSKAIDTFVYHAGLHANGRSYTGLGPNCLHLFGQKLKELTEGKKTILVAHNVGYDLAFLVEFVHKHIHKDKIKKIEGMEDSTHKFLNATIKADGLNLEFMDTGRGDMFMSLEKGIVALKLQKIRKLKIDYKKGNFRTSGTRFYYENDNNEKMLLPVVEEKQYLKNDLAALPEIRHAIAMTKDNINKLSVLQYVPNPVGSGKALRKSMTKASFAKKTLEQYLGEKLEDKYRVKIEYPFYILQDNSYVGGFTCGNRFYPRVQSDKEDIISIDVNSMYPSIMAIKLPFGYVSLEKPEGDYVTWVVLKGSYCEYKKEGDFLDKHIISNQFKRIIKDGGEFIMLKELYDIMIEMCDTDVYIDREYYQRTCDDASDYFKVLFKERNKYKNTDTNMADLIKLLMNSTFGKFSEKHHDSKYIGNQEKEEMELTNTSDQQYRQILTGMYICTLARCILIKAIMQETRNGNTFYYCDTDSIKMKLNNPPVVKINNTQLGSGKDEGKYDLFMYPFKKKRGYLYNSKTGAYKFASGGFNKKCIEQLTHEERCIFFDINSNVKVVNGRKLKRRVKYNKTYILEVDVFTNDELEVVTHIMELNRGRGTIREINE